MYFFISSIQPLTLNNNIFVDLIGYPQNADKYVKHVIRISGIKVSITIMYPPPLISFENFDFMVREATSKECVETRIVYLKDAHFYYFDEKFKYLEIISSNLYELKRIYQELTKSLLDYYLSIGYQFEFKDMYRIENDVEDYGNNYSYYENQVFFKNIESPWRFTENSLSINSVKYYLSCKYNIPQIGWVKIDDKYFVSDGIPEDFIYKCPLLKLNGSAINNIDQKVIIPAKLEKELPMPLVLLSYDIETVTDDHIGIPLWNNGGYIITISAGVFKIDDPKPYRRVCFISKQVEPDIAYTYDDTKKRITISDGTEIYVCANEKELINKFCSFIHVISPDFICTFNGYGYDDPFVYYRAGGPDRSTKYSNYELKDALLQAYSVYNIGKLTKYHKYIIPQFKKIELKIDGERDTNNQSIISQCCISVDVYKVLKKLDPKRFSAPGSGTLNKMLETYNIKDPFNNQLVAQKTGLTIEKMNEYWDSNEPCKVYQVAKYCTQDAYITGTLLIEKSIILDYIEKAIASCTSVFNSFLHADGIRVNKVIISYAYKFGFAYMDTSPTERASHGEGNEYETYTNESAYNIVNEIEKEQENAKKQKLVHETLGMKVHDENKIVGGAVKSYFPGKHKFVIALDFSSMYPSQKEGSNIDSSTRIDEFIIHNPSKFNIEVSHIEQFDFYAIDKKRKFFYITRNNKLFLVEQFFAEFSTDKITYQKPLYFVQNTNEVFDTFKQAVNRKSLKGIMLFDLRQLRNEAKRQLKMLKDQLTSIDSSQDDYLVVKREINRFKAKELSYKILCNSEYGASDSKFFSHYDPDIAAAVTCSSRRLIAFLRYILETGIYGVTDQDLKNLEGHLSNITYELKEYSEENLSSLIDTEKSYFPVTWSFSLNKQHILVLPKSKVIYQDTDSNYYINTNIQNEVDSKNVKQASDEIMTNGSMTKVSNEIMTKMYAYNEIVSYLCKTIVNRNPISTGFEGAFLISRYFNVKKRYYGFKWAPKMNIELYDNKYLIKIDRKKIDEMALSDYLDELGIKVTGVDLTRRDIYRFINIFHLFVLHEDLSFNESDLFSIILNMLLDFRNDVYSENSSYNIEDFAMVDKLKLSTSKYKSTSKTKSDYVLNKAYMIKEKLEAELKLCETEEERERIKSLIPSINQQIKYFVSGDSYLNSFKVTDNAEIVDEKSSKNLNNYINRLNLPYYFDKLCSAIGSYLDDSNFFKDFKDTDEISKFLFEIFYTTKSRLSTSIVTINTNNYFPGIEYKEDLVKKKEEFVQLYNVINFMYIYMSRNRVVKFNKYNIANILSKHNINTFIPHKNICEIQDYLFSTYIRIVKEEIAKGSDKDIVIKNIIDSAYQKVVDPLKTQIERIYQMEKMAK